MILSLVFSILLSSECFSGANAVQPATIPSPASSIFLFDSRFSSADSDVYLDTIPSELNPAFLILPVNCRLSNASHMSSAKSPFDMSNIDAQRLRSISALFKGFDSVLAVSRHINALFFNHKVRPIALSHGYS
jgi:hypothetical protein